MNRRQWLTRSAAASVPFLLPAAARAQPVAPPAGKSSLKITDNAVQVLGGHGYIRDHPVELWLRNARGFATFDGVAIV